MSLLDNIFSSLSSGICIYYSTGAGKGVLTAKQMVPLQSISSYLIVLKSYLKCSLHLCAVLGENPGMSNVSRTQGDFFFLVHICLQEFYNNGYLCCSIFVHAFPLGRVLYLEAHVNLTLE